MAGFLKPPTVHCRGDNVACARERCSRRRPPLPDFDPEQGRPDPARQGRRGVRLERIVGVRAADTFFSYIAGRSRYGKTELAIAQFVHLVRYGPRRPLPRPPRRRAGADPALPERSEAARAGGRDRPRPRPRRAAQPGWNLFELGGAGAEGEGRVEAIVDAFASAMEWGERSTRAINLTSQAAGALAAIAKVLPAELAPTIFQLPTLLSDEGWREAALPFLPARRPALLARPLPAAQPRGDHPGHQPRRPPARSRRRCATLLGQSQSTFRVREAMDEGLIVLACPGSGGTRERLVANLLVFDLLHAARGRGELAPGEAQALLGLPRRGAELRRRRLGQPCRAARAERPSSGCGRCC